MGEKICALCCGRERETTIDCPLDCSYLVAAHRYEAEHRRPPSADDYPYKDVEFSVEFVYERWPLVAGIASVILRFQAQQRDLHDPEIFTAIERLAETYRTLGSGIYYERPPDAVLPQLLYREVQQFLESFREAETNRTGFSSIKDTDIFNLLVFLLRMNRAETNGRPRSRAFLEFLRARFPLSASASSAEPDSPRIIIP
jgi:hypothetical protein